MDKTKIAIVGLGLIGGSLALALNKDFTVYGMDNNACSVSYALNTGMIAKGQALNAPSDYNFIKDCQMVFIAVPVALTLSTAEDIFNQLGNNIIITDVASVKGVLSKAQGRVVGGHPMAGTENSGVTAAVKDLFKGAWYCLVKYKNTVQADFDVVKEVAEKYLLSKTIELSYANHDSIVAKISHLPHAAAYALTNSIDCTHTFIAGSGYMDTTRIASSSPKFWANVMRLNKQNILYEIDNYKRSLKALELLIQSDNYSGVEEYFAKAKNKRDNAKIKS